MDFLKKMMNKDIELGETLVDDLSKIAEAKRNRAVVVEYKGNDGKLYVVALSKNANIAMIYDHEDQLNIESRMVWGTESIYSDFVESAARISKKSDNNRYHIFVNTFSHAPVFVDYLSVIFRDYTIQKAYELTQAYDFFDSIEERNVYDIREEDIVKMTFFNQSPEEMGDLVSEVSERISVAERKIADPSSVDIYDLILSDSFGLDEQEDTDKLIMAASEAGGHSIFSVKAETTGFLWVDILERIARANERGWLKLTDLSTGKPVDSFASKEKPVPDYSYKSKVGRDEGTPSAVESSFGDDVEYSFEEGFKNSSDHSEPHDESESQMASEIIARSLENSESEEAPEEGRDEDDYGTFEVNEDQEPRVDRSTPLFSPWENLSREQNSKNTQEEEDASADESLDEEQGSDEKLSAISSDELLMSFEDDYEDEDSDENSASSDGTEHLEEDESSIEDVQVDTEEGLEPDSDGTIPSEEDVDSSKGADEQIEEEHDIFEDPEVSDITVEEEVNYEVEGNDSSDLEDDDERTLLDDDVFTTVDEDEEDLEEDEDPEAHGEKEKKEKGLKERGAKSLPIIDPSDVSTFSSVNEDTNSGSGLGEGIETLKLERQKREDFSAAFEDLIREKHSAQTKLNLIPNQERSYNDELKHLNGNLDNVSDEINSLEEKLEEARVRRDEAVWEYDRLSSQLDERHSAAVKSRHRASQVSILLEKLETERKFYTNSIQSADFALEKAKQKRPSFVGSFLETLEAMDPEIGSADIDEEDSKSTPEHQELISSTEGNEEDVEYSLREAGMEDEGGGVIPSSTTDRYKFRGDYIDPETDLPEEPEISESVAPEKSS